MERMIKIGAIIQARMNSSRLKGKILKELNSKTVLEHVYFRTMQSLVSECIVATSDNTIDDIVYELCKIKNIPCFRGSEDNVLERFYFGAKKYHFDIIVRITADDPLKDSRIINQAVSILLDGQYDYVSNTIIPTYPEGLDVEVFTFNTLEKTFLQADLLSEREHVTPFIWKNPETFRIYNFKYFKDLSYMRWTMDTFEDYEFMKKIYSHFQKKEIFFMEDILHVIKQHPEYLEINKGHIRNEGYLKSLKEERNEENF